MRERIRGAYDQVVGAASIAALEAGAAGLRR
jgi:hypothetical protein